MLAGDVAITIFNIIFTEIKSVVYAIPHIKGNFGFVIFAAVVLGKADGLICTAVGFKEALHTLACTVFAAAVVICANVRHVQNQVAVAHQAHLAANS